MCQNNAHGPVRRNPREGLRVHLQGGPAGDPKNPDFAYNLAVSLDHLRQVKPALQHYRLALQLAQGGRGAGFDAQAVRARIAQLER